MLKLDQLDLSARARNALQRSGIFYLNILLTKSREELDCYTGIGPSIIDEVERALAKHQLRLRASDYPVQPTKPVAFSAELGEVADSLPQAVIDAFRYEGFFDGQAATIASIKLLFRHGISAMLERLADDTAPNNLNEPLRQELSTMLTTIKHAL